MSQIVPIPKNQTVSIAILLILTYNCYNIVNSEPSLKIDVDESGIYSNSSAYFFQDSISDEILWPFRPGKNVTFLEEIQNYTLKVAVTFTTGRSIYQAQLPNGSFANLYGTSNIAYGCLLDLQQIFGFKIKIIPSIGWITEGVNGSLTGSGGQVRDGFADIGLDISKPVVYRARDLTFLHAIKQDRLCIVFREPKLKSYRSILIRTFKDGLWKRVMLSWLAILISSLAIYRKRDMHAILLPIVGAMIARSVNVGAVLRSSSRSLHILVFVASVFGLTMYSIYSAFIVSSLRKHVPPVKSFKDLLTFEYQLVAQRALPDFTNVFVTDAKQGRKYASIARKNFVNESVSLHLLFGGDGTGDENHRKNPDSTTTVNLAWFVLKSDFYYMALQNNYTTREICSISVLEPSSSPEHPRLLAMFIQKQETNASAISINGVDGMREHLNRRILDLISRGIVHLHIKRFESEFEPTCSSRKRIQVQQIHIYDVYTAYYILIYGACVATAIMIVGEVLLPYFWLVTKKRLRFKPTSRVLSSRERAWRRGR